MNKLKKIKLKINSPRYLNNLEKSSKYKHSQAQIIVTVLLILIVLAAVAILSNFVINLVRDNLGSTDCFNTLGQLSFNQEYTYFNITEDVLFVSVSRGAEDFNLSGLVIGVDEGAISKPYQILRGTVPGTGFKSGYVVMYNNRSGNLALDLPDSQETKTYEINLSGEFAKPVKVNVGAIVGKDKVCEFSDETSVDVVQ